ncbi:hypothetical protein NBH00_20010 [Paraconexibacter antarcticus]|uniref:B3/B4 tRNA-binding domain-containing protein n=1 Tax=Paraconexibacter antarcticus TaxID=2949664 RepID=A0ABY5DRQ8_9ACTN|nr:hypothetical protein [Paraconexibacter antarcticus]UTI63616.1 hypothetical protein NBH00_20010 [Paraconexibacter antarcticus]
MTRAAEEGWVGAEVLAEFPGLGLAFLPVRLGDHRDAATTKARLAELEDYFSGPWLTGLAARPLTAAYRVFYRQVGLDPDADRTPVERLALTRLQHGSFASRGLLGDALTIAAIETEIPVLALRGEDVVGPLGLTTARDGETLGGRPLPASTLVVADAARPLAVLFGDDGHPGPHAPRRSDADVVLYAPIVPGVAPVIAHEALWLAAELLGGQES